MILIIAGPSGAGKTRLLESLHSCGFGHVTPYTTRQRRRGERSGVDFHFIGREAFGNMIVSDELLDWDFAFGNYYGYGLELERRARSDEDIAIPVVARMALRLRGRLPRTYLVFVDAHDAVLDRRLADRSTGSEEERQRREARLGEREHARLFDARLVADESVAEDTVTRLVQDARAFVGDS